MENYESLTKNKMKCILNSDWKLSNLSVLPKVDT